MFQAYSVIFTTLDILKHICPHLGMFWQIQAYSKSWQSFMYIKAYSEPMAYSGIFRTVGSFRHYSRAIYANSES